MTAFRTTLLLVCCLQFVFISSFGQDKKIKLEPVDFTKIDKNKNLQTIAMGSCNKQDKSQAYWSRINTSKPDLWIWLGDNVYNDTENMLSMKKTYDEQNKVDGYASLKSKTPIIGTWDDHDYGLNDGGSEYAKKAESRDLLFQFLHVSEKNPAWNREGAYQAYTFGEEGKKVKIYLLDNRYFRGRQLKGAKGYMAYPYADILGDEQWAWLEKELKSSDAEFNIICSGLQVLSNEHGWEKWGNFPSSREKLLEMIGEIEPKGVVIISGDRHHTEVSKINVEGLTNPIYDVTCSSLNLPIASNVDEPNEFRVGEAIGEPNFGLIKIDWKDGKELPEMTIQTLSTSSDKVYHEVKLKAE